MKGPVLKPLIAITVVVILACLLMLAGAENSTRWVNSNGTSFPIFVIAAAIPFALHWLLFLPAFAFQTEHYFDLTGSLSFLCTIAIVLFLNTNSNERGMLLAILITIWAIRLGSFLFLRVKKRGKDTRFTEMKTQFVRYLFTWTLGGFWVLGTMAAALAAMTSSTSPEISALGYFGLACWLLGFTIEVCADRQKSLFREDPDNAKKFISTGLWSWSRHPNYFGESLLWLGIALIALPALSGWQYVTLLSPVFVVLLLVKVSGVRLLENQGEERWGNDPNYQAYKARTSVFIPMPPTQQA